MVKKNELIKQLAKTQMALANSNPTKSAFKGSKASLSCIHCGRYLVPDVPPKDQGHDEDCIWLLAVIATGDYET